MKHKFTALAAAATMAIGTVAHAAEHNILILPDAYFPAITYMEPGDTVRFTNVSGSNQSIIAKNNDWVIGPIAPDSEVTMVIETGVQKTFYNKDLTNDDGTYSVEGKMSFSAAPLN
ncbi:hypothetical protein [uncultured Tateyamaria sp.]|uniref:hypothetical protein n=1 Tax=uncultured Tateyamaria sp. TaxID=455651 RepID=UPI00260D0612|nr:hypothetical protein [uncultured Tateyamaria sp.]